MTENQKKSIEVFVDMVNLRDDHLSNERERLDEEISCLNQYKYRNDQTSIAIDLQISTIQRYQVVIDEYYEKLAVDIQKTFNTLNLLYKQSNNSSESDMVLTVKGLPEDFYSVENIKTMKDSIKSEIINYWSHEMMDKQHKEFISLMRSVFFSWIVIKQDEDEGKAIEISNSVHPEKTSTKEPGFSIEKTPAKNQRNATHLKEIEMQQNQSKDVMGSSGSSYTKHQSTFSSIVAYLSPKNFNNWKFRKKKETIKFSQYSTRS